MWPGCGASTGGVYFQGLLGTLGLAAITVLFGTVLGTVTAICRLSGFRPGQALARFYVWIIRGTPVLLQLYFFWLLLPELLPLEIDETESVVVALIISAGAFVSEIIRAGGAGHRPRPDRGRPVPGAEQGADLPVHHPAPGHQEHPAGAGQ